jgi:hypothetical protein
MVVMIFRGLRSLHSLSTRLVMNDGDWGSLEAVCGTVEPCEAEEVKAVGVACGDVFAWFGGGGGVGDGD